MTGTLFVVGTPIGNLEDLTFRALRTLKEVDVIAAEDTRRTAKLLAHYDIQKSMVSLHEHNEHREAPRLIARIQRGESVALVTDAGTPGIADPGERLVAAAHEAHVRVVPIPGASAIAAAISVSGFDAGEFVFMGFPPRAGTERHDWLNRLRSEARTLVFFEAPHRLERTLGELGELDVKRPILVVRELTKIHEQLVKQLSTETIASLPAKGEFTVVLGPPDSNVLDRFDDASIVDLFGRLTDKAGLSDEDGLKVMQTSFGIPRHATRQALKRHRYSVKRQNDPSP
jgi:16S rRNA (cytidine1402-2'-O)-methyltransferase